MIAECEWVERLYDIRLEPDKILIMITNRRAELQRESGLNPDASACDTCGHLFGGAFCESCSRFIREESDHWIQRVPATPEAKQSGPSPDNS